MNKRKGWQSLLTKLVLMLSAGLLAACATVVGVKEGPEKEQAFSAVISTEDTNQTIVVSALASSDSTLAQGETIALEIRNRGTDPVVFSPDFGAMGYVYSESTGQWDAIGNAVNFPSGQRLLGANGTEIPAVSVAQYKPESYPTGIESEMRIVVSGHILEDAGSAGRPVVGYVDVLLED